ncbi:MerR family transcriptional regulator [Neomegalonema perideroedes]|uniref:MerR family transcriptional regulator n=1 Tax=Neomegalonema perideroedes TaxID=217219 RepID=UPI00036C8975|nr:helix-turn-helix domain-containing protein [Neomegalonema perideroedes]
MSTIGKLSAAAGVKIPTIRYYEQIGLLPEAPRSEGGQRIYDHKALNRLRFIRHSRELGFPLEAIRDLLDLADQPQSSCAAADGAAKAQLAAVKTRILRLKALEAELERMIADCAHGVVADCRVIEVLGDHSLCGHEHHPQTGTL